MDLNQQSNEVKWFMQYQGRVQGPFSTEALSIQLEQMNAQSMDQILLWRRGLAEWVKGSKWQSGELTQTMTQMTASRGHSETAHGVSGHGVSEKTALIRRPANMPESPVSTEETHFKVQVGFVEQPSMSKNDLLALIAHHEDLSSISIQDPRSKEWKEIYSYPELIDQLGISRRKHHRVPILAQFNGSTSRHTEFNARIITISEGGAGFTQVHDLKIGDDVEGQITSPHFFNPINIQAEVVYSGLDGYIGLKFNQINEESKSAIVDYIKKFGKSSSSST